MRRRCALAWMASVASLAACRPVTVFPPPEAPLATMPALAAPMPETRAGMTRVVIATDVPARVERVIQHDGFTSDPRLRDDVVCAKTPCVVMLSRGDYELMFKGLTDDGRSSKMTVGFHGDTEVLNHTLGEERADLEYTAGAVAFGTGTLLFLATVLAWSQDISQDHSSAFGTLEAFGLLGMVVGGSLMADSDTILQPGSTTQWSPPRSPEVGASARLRF